MINRKPDIETENFRAWSGEKLNKKEKKDYDKEAENSPFIDLGDGKKFVLTGFNIARAKDTNKIIFAYKFKHEARMILYWCAENLNEKEKECCDIAIKGLYKFNLGDYKIVNSREWIKVIMGSQMHLIDKMGEGKWR